MVVDIPTESEPIPELEVRRISLRDQAYEAIKQRIVRCELRPGEVMTIVDLAEQLPESAKRAYDVPYASIRKSNCNICYSVNGRASVRMSKRTCCCRAIPR